MLLLCAAGMTRYLVLTWQAFHGLAATLPRHAPGACHSWPAEVPCLLSGWHFADSVFFFFCWPATRKPLTPSAVLCWPDRGPVANAAPDEMGVMAVDSSHELIPCHLSASGAPFPLVISRPRPCLRFAPVVAPRRGPPISTSASSEPSQVDDGELPAALPHLVHVHGWGSQSTGARHDSTRPRHRHREPCATPDASANDAREHPLLRRHKCLKPDGGKKPRLSRGQDTTWRATPSSWFHEPRRPLLSVIWPLPPGDVAFCFAAHRAWESCSNLS